MGWDQSQASYYRGEELGSLGGTTRTHPGSALLFSVSPASMFALLLAPELFVNNLPLSGVQGQPALHSCGLWSLLFLTSRRTKWNLMDMSPF